MVRRLLVLAGLAGLLVVQAVLVSGDAHGSSGNEVAVMTELPAGWKAMGDAVRDRPPAVSSPPDRALARALEG